MAPKKGYCYVHIGAPKTGSTFLQRVFAENRDALCRRSLLYPDVSLRGFGHHDIAFLLSGGYPAWATGQKRSLQELAADLAHAVGGHRGSILLSSENFYLFPEPECLKDFLEATGALADRALRIIVYLRRQDQAHESWYNQLVKAQGEAGTIEESLSRFRDLWDYRSQLDRWSAVFGEDALVVRLYIPPASDPPSLMTDMLRVLDLQDFNPALPSQPINTGENRDILEFQRTLNRLPLSPQERRRFHKELMALSERAKGQGLFDESPLLGASERQSIMERYAEANAAVAERYFRRETLFPDELEPDPPSSEPARPNVEPGLTSTKMLYILGWLLAYKG